MKKRIILIAKGGRKRLTIFAMTTFSSPPKETATSSKIGANFLQCPHHGA